MAFPGGRTDPTDPTPESTAVRETWEEIGLRLEPDHAIGTLAELDGGRATNRLVLVSAHGYWVDGDRPHLTPNYEVADTVWMPLTELNDPSRHIDYYFPGWGIVPRDPARRGGTGAVGADLAVRQPTVPPVEPPVPGLTGPFPALSTTASRRLVLPVLRSGFTRPFRLGFTRRSLRLRSTGGRSTRLALGRTPGGQLFGGLFG